MYVFMITGLSLLMFVIHYVYTTVRRVSITSIASTVHAVQCYLQVTLIEHSPY